MRKKARQFFDLVISQNSLSTAVPFPWIILILLLLPESTLNEMQEKWNGFLQKDGKSTNKVHYAARSQE